MKLSKVHGGYSSHIVDGGVGLDAGPSSSLCASQGVSGLDFMLTLACATATKTVVTFNEMATKQIQVNDITVVLTWLNGPHLVHSVYANQWTVPQAEGERHQSTYSEPKTSLDHVSR